MLRDLVLGVLIALFSHKVMSCKELSTEMYTAVILLITTILCAVIRQ